MTENSNINVSSNLMIDDGSDKPKNNYYPGDFLALLYPSLVDARGIDQELTTRQIEEYKRYLVCITCNKPCAGTCS